MHICCWLCTVFKLLVSCRLSEGCPSWQQDPLLNCKLRGINYRRRYSQRVEAEVSWQAAEQKPTGQAGSDQQGYPTQRSFHCTTKRPARLWHHNETEIIS
jgi:hypothetical protein